MGWFRANGRLGSRLALLALAMQLFLSFGHIHPDDIYGSLKVPFPAHAFSHSVADQELTASNDRSGPIADDLCAICASVSLLGNSVTAEPPKLPLPGPQIAQHAAHVAAFAIAPLRGPFQSRAPPAA
jgi:hypothetical protein